MKGKYILNSILQSRCLRHLLCFYFLFAINNSFAQSNSVMDSCLKKISLYQSGNLNVFYKSKNFFDLDTNEQYQSILFYTDDSLQNNILFRKDSCIHVIIGNEYLFEDYSKKIYFEKLDKNQFGYLVPYIFYFNVEKLLSRLVQENDVSYMGMEDTNSGRFHKFKINLRLSEEQSAEFSIQFYIFIDAKTYLPNKVKVITNYMGSDQYEDVTIHPNYLYKNVNPVISDSIQSTYALFYNQFIHQPQDSMVTKIQDDTLIFAPDWALPKLTDDTLSFNEISSPLVLLDFWYVSCAPCLWAIKELVVLDSLYNEKDLKIVGINVFDNDVFKIQSMADYLKIKYDIVYKGLEVSSLFGGGNGYPKLFLIDTRTKKVIHFEGGYHKGMKEDLQKIINEYLLNQNEGKKN